MPFWSYQPPGEGWLDALSPFQWMQIRPLGTRPIAQPENPALPTVAPGDVATAETCFRLPDGSSVCVLTNDVFATDYGGMGYPQIPQDAPEFVPPPTPEVTGVFGPVVVPSDTSPGVSEDAEDVAVDWGTIFSGAVDIWQGQQVGGAPTVYNPQTSFVGTSLPSTVGTPGMTGACGCNSNPCVCGTINGRPALVDPRTGKRCYRRRRRVMLTEGDFNTLLRIATLPNNANVRTALAKAIGRR